MYSIGSVVGKAALVDPEILLTSHLIFTGGQKVPNLAPFSIPLNFEQPEYKNAEIYLNSAYRNRENMLNHQ